MTREAPEPEAARPAWPAWNAPVALLSSFVLILASAVPLLPAVLLLGFSDTVAALALLVPLLVQDGPLVLAALVFAHPSSPHARGTSASGPSARGRPWAGPCWASP